MWKGRAGCVIYRSRFLCSTGDLEQDRRHTCENRERYLGARYKSRSQPTISEREVPSSLKQNRFSTDPTVAK